MTSSRRKCCWAMPLSGPAVSIPLVVWSVTSDGVIQRIVAAVTKAILSNCLGDQRLILRPLSGSESSYGRASTPAFMKLMQSQSQRSAATFLPFKHFLPVARCGCHVLRIAPVNRLWRIAHLRRGQRHHAAAYRSAWNSARWPRISAWSFVHLFKRSGDQRASVRDAKSRGLVKIGTILDLVKC
jgi:hypothetical protein